MLMCLVSFFGTVTNLKLSPCNRSGDKMENNALGGACSAYGGKEGKPEGKVPLGRPKSRWEDNIKMDLHEVGCGVMDWMELAEDRDRWRVLVNTVINLRVP
jgi:hypothetical protein